jgi:hypothetical protein
MNQILENNHNIIRNNQIKFRENKDNQGSNILYFK